MKQGKLGYFIGHQTHVQSAEADEEVVVKPGEAAEDYLPSSTGNKQQGDGLCQCCRRCHDSCWCLYARRSRVGIVGLG